MGGTGGCLDNSKLLTFNGLFAKEISSSTAIRDLNPLPRFPDSELVNDDWLHWVSHHQAYYDKYAGPVRNYVLLRGVVEELADLLVKTIGVGLYSMGTKHMVRLVGRIIYHMQGKDLMYLATFEVAHDEYGCTDRVSVFLKLEEFMPLSVRLENGS